MKHRIMSLSVPESLARDMDRIQQDMGFPGRSEMLRAGLRKLAAEKKEQEKLKGTQECILIVAHSKHAEGDVTLAKHQFEDIIETQIHSNLKAGKCLELFLLSGDASSIRKMHNTFETNRKIDYVKLIVT